MSSKAVEEWRNRIRPIRLLLLTEEYEDIEPMQVIVVAPGKLLCRSSTDPLFPLSATRILWGDGFEARKLNYDDYAFVQFPPVQDYVHFRYDLGMFGGPATQDRQERNRATKEVTDAVWTHFTPQPFADYLHSIGGELERDGMPMWYVLTVHIPMAKLSDYKTKLIELSPFLALENGKVILSGAIDPDEM